MKNLEEYEEGSVQSDDITMLAFEFFGREQLISEKIVIKNSFESLPILQEKFKNYCIEQGVKTPVIQKMSIVIDDLLNNIISYAYQDDEEHTIELWVEYSKEMLSVTISDDGIPFNPFNTGTVDTTLSLDEREVGGLGILLVKKMVDKFKYRREINKNVVSISINLADHK